MGNYVFKRYEDDKCNKRLNGIGVSFGYGNNTSPYLIEENEHCILARHPATSDWSGRGQSSNYPASYVLYKKLIKDDLKENELYLGEIGEWKYYREKGAKKLALDEAHKAMDEYIFKLTTATDDVKVTIERDSFEGHLLELAIFLGGSISDEQDSKMMPFLYYNQYNKLNNTVNVEFMNNFECDRFKKIAVFIEAYGNKKYADGVNYGGNLLLQLGRAEILNADVDHRLQSEYHTSKSESDNNINILKTGKNTKYR